MMPYVQPQLHHSAAMPVPPDWAEQFVGSGDALMARARIDHATTFDADALRVAVRNAYRSMFDVVGSRHVVRAWNVVPGICDPLGDGDRYMAFNAGRHDAMCERYGDALAVRVPAASGVGCASEDLLIALLATDAPGEPIENPRQTPAFRYSSKYGPLPPCFSRATRAMINGESLLLVSGTAAVIGEDTRAIGDVRAQLALTLDNLRDLLTADDGDASLSRFTSVRVYLPAATFGDNSLRDETRAAFSGCGDVEFVAAELCRRNLLIEIEGVATRHNVRGV